MPTQLLFDKEYDKDYDYFQMLLSKFGWTKHIGTYYYLGGDDVYL